MCIIVFVVPTRFAYSPEGEKKIEENRSFNTVGLICFHRVFFLRTKFHQIYIRVFGLFRALGADAGARNALAWRTFKTVTAYYAYRTTYYYTRPFILWNIYIEHTLHYKIIQSFSRHFDHRHLHVSITIYSRVIVLLSSHFKWS